MPPGSSVSTVLKLITLSLKRVHPSLATRRFHVPLFSYATHVLRLSTDLPVNNLWHFHIIMEVAEITCIISDEGSDL